MQIPILSYLNDSGKKHRVHRQGLIADPHVRPMGTGLELLPAAKGWEQISVDIF